jgi:hypothetical protein
MLFYNTITYNSYYNKLFRVYPHIKDKERAFSTDLSTLCTGDKLVIHRKTDKDIHKVESVANSQNKNILNKY